MVNKKRSIQLAFYRKIFPFNDWFEIIINKKRTPVRLGSQVPITKSSGGD